MGSAEGGIIRGSCLPAWRSHATQEALGSSENRSTGCADNPNSESRGWAPAAETSPRAGPAKRPAWGRQQDGDAARTFVVVYSQMFAADVLVTDSTTRLDR